MDLVNILYCLSLSAIISSSPATAAEQAQATPEKVLTTKAKPRVLVITYSETGNTKAVAEIIIKRFGADSIFVKAPQYADETRSASGDAWDEVKTAKISPETVDMSNYDLVFLGSPIWWYRPAVPLWAFVGHNNFKGKKVVLFNTFNSRFKEKYITEFKQAIEATGGELIDHIYVRRGRVFWQIDREELLQKFGAVLDEKADAFLN